jgi:hypothetical protein
LARNFADSFNELPSLKPARKGRSGGGRQTIKAAHAIGARVWLGGPNDR